MKFCDKLKKLRNEKGITQSELADSIYVSRSMIAKYECGNIYPTKENMEKLAVFFNVKLSYLIDNEESCQLSLESYKLIKSTNNFVFYLSVSICTIFIVFSFIPFLSGFRYVYPIPQGQNQPNKEYYVWSIFYSNFINNNPIVIITLTMCFINVLLYVIWKTKQFKASIKHPLWMEIRCKPLFY